jgi:putative aldouronate transport system permease protein
MSLPAVIFFLIFAYQPMTGIVLAFKDYDISKGIYFSDWNNFKNFRFLFLGGRIFKIAFNTVAFNIAFMAVNTVLQVTIAIFLTEIRLKYYRKAAQSLMFLPYFISWVVVGAFLYALLNYEFGALNVILKSIGMNPVDVYGTTSVWKYIIVTVSAWKGVGYGSVIYLAAITSIDAEIYEAADIDGATKFQKSIRITLPCLRPQIVLLCLLSVGNIFRGDFQMFYQVTSNNPMLYEATDVIDTFVTRSLMRGGGDIGMAAAAGVTQSVICFIVLVTVNQIVKKVESDYALF